MKSSPKNTASMQTSSESAKLPFVLLGLFQAFLPSTPNGAGLLLIPEPFVHYEG